MNEGLYPPRRCRKCGRRFQPRYANEHIHPDCRRDWNRKYQRDYQRKVRKELKRGWEEEASNET